MKFNQVTFMIMMAASLCKTSLYSWQTKLYNMQKISGTLDAKLGCNLKRNINQRSNNFLPTQK